MKNGHIRVLVVLAIVTLVGIIVTQVYWLNRSISQQDQVFNHNVQLALRKVVESLCVANGKDFPTVNPIEQVSKNYFIVRTNDRIDLANLEYLITAEIKKRAISDAFEYGVYDCASDAMVYGENVSLTQSNPNAIVPDLRNEEYYFGVYFPDKSKNIIAGFDLWKFTSGITLVVIIFFGYALFVILKQKRLGEVQRDFINNVSHELKTPLSTLSLAAHSLSEKRDTSSSARYISIIAEEVARLEKSVQDILLASWVSEAQPRQQEKIVVCQFLKKLVQELEAQHPEVSYSVVCDETLQVVAARPELEMCFKNLLENAIKYGASHIRISATTGARSIIFAVQDNGRGIDKKEIKKIFRKFYRVPDLQQQHNAKGFGLGLYIVKNTIKKMGGKVSAQSIPGAGSTFKIEIPHD